MEKRNKIIYWVATIWLSLGMVSTGIVQLLQMKQEAAMFTHLGYPLYLMPLLAVWKFSGVAAVLMPKFAIIKEWAYAGFIFAMSGAVFSHAAVGDSGIAYFGPLLLITLTIVSWYYRPADRKVNTVNQ